MRPRCSPGGTARVMFPFLLRLFFCLVTGFLFLALLLVIKPTLLEPFVVARQTTTRADALVVMAGSRYERIPAAAQLYHQMAATDSAGQRRCAQLLVPQT